MRWVPTDGACVEGHPPPGAHCCSPSLPSQPEGNMPGPGSRCQFWAVLCPGPALRVGCPRIITQPQGKQAEGRLLLLPMASWQASEGPGHSRTAGEEVMEHTQQQRSCALPLGCAHSHSGGNPGGLPATHPPGTSFTAAATAAGGDPKEVLGLWLSSSWAQGGENSCVHKLSKAQWRVPLKDPHAQLQLALEKRKKKHSRGSGGKEHEQEQGREKAPAAASLLSRQVGRGAAAALGYQ